MQRSHSAEQPADAESTELCEELPGPESKELDQEREGHESTELSQQSRVQQTKLFQSKSAKLPQSKSAKLPQQPITEQRGERGDRQTEQPDGVNRGQR